MQCRLAVTTFGYLCQSGSFYRSLSLDPEGTGAQRPWETWSASGPWSLAPPPPPHLPLPFQLFWYPYYKSSFNLNRRRLHALPRFSVGLFINYGLVFLVGPDNLHHRR